MNMEQHQQQVGRVIDALLGSTYLQTKMHSDPEFRAAIVLLAGALPRFVQLLAEEADERAKQYALMAEAIRRGEER